MSRICMTYTLDIAGTSLGEMLVYVVTLLCYWLVTKVKMYGYDVINICLHYNMFLWFTQWNWLIDNSSTQTDEQGGERYTQPNCFVNEPL